MFAACWQPARPSQLSLVQGLVSSQLIDFPGTQLPAVQTSPTVQTLPSSQGPLLARLLQPVMASQLSVVQGFVSSHTLALPGAQLPPLQTSWTVHTLSSEQGWALVENTQPLDLSQLSSVHGLASLHVTALPPVQPLSLHTSPWVHGLPSSQARLLAVLAQPLEASQKSAVHGLLSSQVRTLPDAHWPPLQTSFCVQTLPSLQGAELGVNTQPLLGSQLSSLQPLPSEQASGLPPLQLPRAHWSAVVQTLPSSQGALLFALLQPPIGSQFSVVQGFPSSQLLAAVGLQVPPLQVSPWVQLL